MSRRILIALIVLVLIVAGIIWLLASRDKEATAPVLSVAAYNQTKNKPATDQPASANDLIAFTLTAENQSDDVINGYIMEASLTDITSRASLADASGASYNAATNSLVWTPLDIPANESISKQFTVKVNPLPTGISDASLKIKFNNELEIRISQATVSGGVTSPTVRPTTPLTAPKSGVSEWLPLILAVIVTSAVLTLKKPKFVKA